MSIRFSILALVAGAGAGIISATWTTRSLDDYAQSLRFTSHIPETRVQKPSPIPGTYEEALARVRESAAASVVTILPASTRPDDVQDWFTYEDVLGYGAVISDDGWVIVDASVLEGMTEPSTQVVMWIRGQTYAVSFVVRDVRTRAVMMKTEAVNLSPIPFADTQEIRAGEMVFAVTANGSVSPTAVTESDYPLTLVPTKAEEFSTQWMLTSEVASLSEPLVNGAGELVGLVQGDSIAAMPLHHTVEALRDILRGNTVMYVDFGAYVVDLARAYNVPQELRQEVRAGALIMSPGSGIRAMTRGGAAAEAGLAEYDIVLAVDGERVTETTTLAEILSAYHPHDVVQCTILRGGKTLNIPVTLGDAVNVI